MPALPRRFGYVFEFDRNGGPAAGTPEQQAFIRLTVATHATQGGKFDRVLFSLAKKVKTWTSHIPISWNPELGANGWTFPYLMLLNSNLQPNSYLEFVFLHELGHLVGRHLINPIDKSEGWADQFAYWVLAGCQNNPSIEGQIVLA